MTESWVVFSIGHSANVSVIQQEHWECYALGSTKDLAPLETVLGDFETARLRQKAWKTKLKVRA